MLDYYLEDTFILSLGFLAPPLGPAGVGIEPAGTVGAAPDSVLGGGILAESGDPGRAGDPTSTVKTSAVKTSVVKTSAVKTSAPMPTSTPGGSGTARGGESTSTTGSHPVAAAGEGTGQGHRGGEPWRGGDRESDSAADRAFFDLPAPSLSSSARR